GWKGRDPYTGHRRDVTEKYSLGPGESPNPLRLRGFQSRRYGRAMVAAFYLLLSVGALGFFDVLYFHGVKCRLAERPDCQREVLWHTARHLVYASQFAVVANLRFH